MLIYQCIIPIRLDYSYWPNWSLLEYSIAYIIQIQKWCTCARRKAKNMKMINVVFLIEHQSFGYVIRTIRSSMLGSSGFMPLTGAAILYTTFFVAFTSLLSIGEGKSMFWYSDAIAAMWPLIVLALNPRSLSKYSKYSATCSGRARKGKNPSVAHHCLHCFRPFA